MTETEIERYERLCKEAGITTITMNFFVKPETLFKFFRVVIKDCNKKIEEKPKTLLSENQQKIVNAIENKARTTRQISEITGLAIRTVQQHTKLLGELNVLIKFGDTNEWIVNTLRRTKK